MKQVLLVRRLLTAYLHSGVHSLLEGVGVCRDVSLLPCLLSARTEEKKQKARIVQARAVLE